ncbi:hypothetical protein [Caryophanon tenue]|uniref:Uncharacterized protein n=1 Tax=Caryophanon tenue TaxID=33978 RepID=A0A1C0YIZ7_9BACL|nr:hypothetical protein [Caryophanon tenue]OCS87156.1 hypothetical protein A6M13_11020 [Caryophanon tenue]
MTDEEKLRIQLMDCNDDWYLLTCLWEMDYKIKQLKEGYYQRYFPKNLKRNWGFNCCQCGERVQSDKDEFYYIVTIKWKDPHKPGKRFCSSQCADIFVSESEAWILRMKKVYQDARMNVRN